MQRLNVEDHHLRFSPDVRSLMFEAHDCQVSIAHQQLRCQMGVGTGSGHSWQVAVGRQLSAVVDAGTSYAPPVVTDFRSADEPELLSAVQSFETIGGQGILVKGRNFGPSLTSGQYNAVISASSLWQGIMFNASRCEVSVAHVEIACLTSWGVGAQLPWEIVVDDQASVQSTTSYGPPEVTVITGDGAANASTLGGQTFTLSGKNFGPCRGCSVAAAREAARAGGAISASSENFLDRVSYGPYGTQYAPVDCHVSVPHVEIVCTTVPGAGRLLAVMMGVGGQVMWPDLRDTSENRTISYAGPAIFSWEPLQGTTFGGYRVVLRGRSLAESSTLLFGGREVTDKLVDKLHNEWVEFTVPPGQGEAVPLQVVFESERVECRQSSNVMDYAYRGPRIERIVTQEDTYSRCSVEECIAWTMNGLPPMTDPAAKASAADMEYTPAIRLIRPSAMGMRPLHATG